MQWGKQAHRVKHWHCHHRLKTLLLHWARIECIVVTVYATRIHTINLRTELLLPDHHYTSLWQNCEWIVCCDFRNEQSPLGLTWGLYAIAGPGNCDHSCHAEQSLVDIDRSSQQITTDRDLTLATMCLLLTTLHLYKHMALVSKTSI